MKNVFLFSFWLGISFSISIRSGASGYSLCKSWSFFEYSKSTSRIQPLPSWSKKFSPIFQICHQLETSHRQWQTHCPTIESVSVKILDEFWFFILIEFLTHIFIVGFCISFSNHWDSTNALLNHQKHNRIRKKFKLNPRLFQTSIPSQPRCGVIQCWIQFIVLHANISEILKTSASRRTSVLRYRSWYSQKVVILKCFHTFSACSKSLSVVSQSFNFG